jgi:prephenate dehydrogenase
MTVKITIVGLGQIGASIGLALAEQKEIFQRIGHDRDRRISKAALKMGAVDRSEANLPSAVRDADIIMLALPMDQIKETLSIIAEDLREDVVVMDTGPVKEVVAAWVGELLPPKCHYVGLTPVLNPNYLLEAESGLESAHPDLFRGSLVGIVSLPRTPSDAIKLAADLTRLLGASPLFVDPMEIDSLMAATHILPQLMSASLLNATVDQPGWREARKVAGRAYAEVTSPTVQLSEPQALQTSVMLNRENVLRVMDSLAASLQAIRNDIVNEDSEALEARLDRARIGRELWWHQRQNPDWDESAAASAEIPTGPDLFGRLFGSRGKTKKR